MKFFAGLLLCFVVLPMLAKAQSNFIPRTVTHLEAENSEPREHLLDVTHLRVDVRFDTKAGKVFGRVTHQFYSLRKSLDSIFFDALDMTIESASLNGKPVRFAMTKEGVNVFPSLPLTWGKLDSITFTYTATPKRGLYFIGWNDPDGLSRKQIWTQGQGIDNRHWIPMYDEMNDKVVSETWITFDKNYEVLSNGRKLSELNNSDGTKTWHYEISHRHAPYLIMIAIGEYGIKHDTTRAGVPVNMYYYRDQPESVEPTYARSAEAVDFIAEETGVPYPWSSYSMIPVQDFIYGAMENTTATVYGDFYYTDPREILDRNFLYVNVHELTHQWFGDFITARSGKHSWLQESFATFYPKLFTRKISGQDAYEWQRRDEQNQAIEASKHDLYPIVHNNAGTARMYPKGSTVLDMMMYTFGEDQFRRVIKHYLTHHAYSSVETSDLYHSFQDTLGLTPDWFFEEWLYRGGEPSYNVAYNTIKGATVIDVTQTHHMDELVGPFKMPIVFEVHYADGSVDSTRQMIEKVSSQITIPNPQGKPIDFVLFDPGSNILKTVTFHKSYHELESQARKADHFLDRLDAIAALRGDSTFPNAKNELLAELYTHNYYYPIRKEIISQYAGSTTSAGVAMLRRGLTDPQAEVRLASLNAVRGVPELLRPEVERMLTDSSYNVEQLALTKLVEAYPAESPRYLDITKNDLGASNKVRISWLEIRARNGDESALNQLVRYVSNSFEFITRQNAMAALKRLNYMNEAFAANLLNALTGRNGRLAGSAYDTINYFIQQSAARAIFLNYYHSRTWSPEESSSIERIMK